MSVPKVIHRIWLGGEEPEWTYKLSFSWSRPGWEIHQWTDANIPTLFPLRNQDIWDRAPEIAPDHVGQLRSDVLRYELLDRFGGVYVDADFECLKPIDPLVDGVACFAAWEIQDKWLNNAILGSVGGHPFIRALTRELPRSVERLQGRAKPNRMTGPGLITRVYREHGQGVTVYDRELFYPYGFDEISDHGPGEHFEGAYAVHHWNNKRREQGVPVV